jgi:hypothetical protein
MTLCSAATVSVPTVVIPDIAAVDFDAFGNEIDNDDGIDDDQDDAYQYQDQD